MVVLEGPDSPDFNPKEAIDLWTDGGCNPEGLGPGPETILGVLRLTLTAASLTLTLSLSHGVSVSQSQSNTLKAVSWQRVLCALD